MGAMLAAATLFAVPTPATRNVTSVVQTGQKDQAPVTINNMQVNTFAIPRTGAVYSRYGGPIWVGTAKRGNRRNRSRFNFNR